MEFNWCVHERHNIERLQGGYACHQEAARVKARSFEEYPVRPSLNLPWLYNRFLNDTGDSAILINQIASCFHPFGRMTKRLRIEAILFVKFI